MPARYTQLVAKAGDRVLLLIKQAEDVTVEVVGQVAKSVASVVPEPPVNPIGETIASPRELVTTAFSVADKFVKTQKSYALGLVKALEPITAKLTANGGPRRAR